jgi:hypothetical protein
MKKEPGKKIKVRYISSERKAEKEIDAFLMKVNAGRSFNIFKELS